MADGDSRASAERRDSPRPGSSRTGRKGSAPGLLPALAIVALAGLVVLLVYGSLTEGVFLALLILAVVAAVYPPLAIGLGLAVIAYLAIARGGLLLLFGWISSLTLAQEQPASGPFTPLGPTLPGYVNPAPGPTPKI